MKRILAFTLLASPCLGGGIAKLELPCHPPMTRAVLQYIEPQGNPHAVLVLCPGENGDGAELIRRPEWQSFAKKYDLGLVGLSFASPFEANRDGTGYFYAAKDSGAQLLDGVHQIYGKDLPLLLYGFSGGAHFTSRFERWKPERVMAWCAYSACWWDDPVRSSAAAPGIVACGDEDPGYGASLIYFKQGRALGKPWIWISLGRTGHTWPETLDRFVREFFASLLRNQEDSICVDVDEESKASLNEEEMQPSLTGRLPSNELFDAWKNIHEP